MTEQTTLQPTGKWLRLGIIGIGVIVFLLLFFADKTNLNDPDKSDQVAGRVPEATQQVSSLPPLAADAQFDRWEEELEGASSEQQEVILDSMISLLVTRNRLGHASEYLEKKLSLNRSLDQLAFAGKINQQATELPYIISDSTLFKTFTQRAITYLSTVVESQPENEDALLHLGLALTQSRDPQNSMRGILSIRKVLEINPDNAEAGIRLGIFSLQTGQLEKAEQRFQQVLVVQPDNHLARFQLGITRIQQQRVEEAKNLLNQVVQEATDSQLKLEAREILLSLNTK